MQKRFFGQIKQYSLAQIAEHIGAKISNQNTSKQITDVSTLESADDCHITFFSNKKYKHLLSKTTAGACIVEEQYLELLPKNTIALITDNPYLSHAKTLDLFYPDNIYYHLDISTNKEYKVGENSYISPNATVCKGAVIGDNCHIMPGVFIGADVQIGDNTKIFSNASISHAIIGANCTIHAGARIGQEGFGFTQEGRTIIKVKQIGHVSIANHVEIGANTCIDRGSILETRIGNFTKIDNLVQIGHSVEIGDCSIIVACSAIAGSSKIGNGVTIGGQVGIAGHLNIQDGCSIAAQSGVIRDIEKGKTVGGSPAVDIRDWHKQNVLLKRMLDQKKI